MKCAVCNDQMVNKHGEVELRISGKLLLVENVSYQECESCGERVLIPEVSQEIFKKVAQKDYKEQQIIVPVIQSNTASAI